MFTVHIDVVFLLFTLNIVLRIKTAYINFDKIRIIKTENTGDAAWALQLKLFAGQMGCLKI